VNVNAEENDVEISRVAVRKPFARFAIFADGTSNFDALTADNEETEPEGADTGTETSEPLRLRIGATEVSGGSVDFSDDTLPLPFRALISRLEGSVGAVDTSSAVASEVGMEGEVGDYGEFTLDGKLSLLAPTDKADMNLVFRNITMPTLSPYTAQFAGRTIATGKLDLDLNYGLDGGIMEGANNIVMRDFTLGDKVESPDAVDLPLDLALALLKDTNGVIDLDLGVSGDVNDPSFSASGIILKAFVDLISKAVTSPFKLLGGLVPGGGGKDIDDIGFRAGRSELAPPEREKLDVLAAALTQRPELMLVVGGTYDAEADSQTLRAAAFDQELAGLLDASTEDEAQLLEQTRKALEKLAGERIEGFSRREQRELFSAPDPETGEQGFDEVAYMANLREQLEALQPVPESELLALADARRDAIIAALTGTGVLDAARITAADATAGTAGDDGRIVAELSLDVGDA